MYMEPVPQTYNNIVPSFDSLKYMETPQNTLDANDAPQSNASTNSGQRLSQSLTEPFFDPSSYMQTAGASYNDGIDSSHPSSYMQAPQDNLDANDALHSNAENIDSIQIMSQSLIEPFFDPSCYMQTVDQLYNDSIGTFIDRSTFIQDPKTASRDTSQSNATNTDSGEGMSQSLAETFFDPSFYMQTVDPPYNNNTGPSIYPMRQMRATQNTLNANDVPEPGLRMSIGATQGISDSFFNPSSYMKAVQQAHENADSAATPSRYEQAA
jgi:hypothetical protein